MYRNRKTFKRRPSNSCGFTLIELVVSVAIIVILTSISVPIVKTSMANYRIASAVNSVTGVINSTRYKAIYNGYPFNITIAADGNYQIANKIPPAGSFTNVGTTVPYKPADITLTNGAVTLQFNPSGLVSATTGALNNIKLTYRQGQTDAQSRTIQVSAYGNITVTNP